MVGVWATLFCMVVDVVFDRMPADVWALTESWSFVTLVGDNTWLLASANPQKEMINVFLTPTTYSCCNWLNVGPIHTRLWGGQGGIWPVCHPSFFSREPQYWVGRCRRSLYCSSQLCRLLLGLLHALVTDLLRRLPPLLHRHRVHRCLWLNEENY